MCDLSLCIPLIENNITKKHIKNVLNKYKFGKINRIDLISVNKYKRAFIHYKYWYNNNQSKYIQDLLSKDLDFKIIYKYPWFWKCMKNYSFV